MNKRIMNKEQGISSIEMLPSDQNSIFLVPYSIFV